jgi:hypothetical protein
VRKRQGCLNGRPTVKITDRTSTDVVRTSTRIRVYPADTILPADGFLPSADAEKIASARMRQRIRAGAGPRRPAPTRTHVPVGADPRVDTRRVDAALGGVQKLGFCV